MTSKYFRIAAAILAGSLTLGILIGGNYLWHKIFYTNPIEASVAQISDIKSFEIEHSQLQAKVRVQFREECNLKTTFYALLGELKSQMSNSSSVLKIEVANEPAKELKSFLREAQFPIYEAISTGKYTQLPSLLSEMADQKQIHNQIEIDDNFIFLTVHKNGQIGHLIIKRSDFPLEIINTMGGDYI